MRFRHQPGRGAPSRGVQPREARQRALRAQPWARWTLAAILCIGGAGAPPPVSAAGWPTFQGQPDRNAVVVGDPAAAALTPSWRFATGGSLVVGPSVSGRTVYLTSMDHRVYALDLATGRLRWSFRADNQIMSQAVLAGGRLFFGSGTKGFSGTHRDRIRGTGPNAVYALNASSGHLDWIHHVVGEAMPTPAYSHGVVYEPTGGGIFYALAAGTGRLLWSLRMRSIVSMSSPVIAGHIAIFGGTAGGRPPAYYGIDLQTHRVAWVDTFPAAWGGPDDLSPTFGGGVAYVQVPDGSPGEAGGKRCTVWPCGGAASWVPRGARPMRIVELALRASTGQRLWERTLGYGPARFHGGEEAGVATLSGGVLYVGTPVLGGLWALHARTGRTIWRSTVPQPIRAAPTVLGNRVYAVSGSGMVYALNRITGTVEAALRVGRRPPESVADYVMIPCTTPSATAVGGSLLVAGGRQNTLVALPMSRLRA